MATFTKSEIKLLVTETAVKKLTSVQVYGFIYVFLTFNNLIYELLIKDEDCKFFCKLNTL